MAVTQYEIVSEDGKTATVRFFNDEGMEYRRMIRIPKSGIDSPEFEKIVNDHFSSVNLKLEEGLLELYPTPGN